MARQVRIAGLVRAAEMIRRELAAPITAQQRESLRKRVESNLTSVQRILREERGEITDMPAPSQRAYLFLAGLDWKKLGASNLVATDRLDSPLADNDEPARSGSDTGDRGSSTPQTKMVWPGLNTVLERMMEILGEVVPGDGDLVENLNGSIVRLSRQIELTIQRKSISPIACLPKPTPARLVGVLQPTRQSQKLCSGPAMRESRSRRRRRGIAILSAAVDDSLSTGTRHL